ncbi:hypothetical protein [Candidatus Paracaedibacter symbiosus]|uniref:hypothetical protein n=1 Tax=Candidatus Paracaedibacter symbiosus TaxID=244582 RepID=UPI0005096989|nr:hypothetical protein [Candidatus Paracaedibacter symbiosus]
MRISIILENQDGKLIEKITKGNNADYLVKGENNPDFPYLAEVEIDDYSVFAAEDMDAIIEELLCVRQEVTDPADQVHIDDIIRLAKKCKETPETVLTFAG